MAEVGIACDAAAQGPPRVQGLIRHLWQQRCLARQGSPPAGMLAAGGSTAGISSCC